MKKRLIFFAIGLLGTVSLFADEVTIYGIQYVLNVSDMTASVSPYRNRRNVNQYTGNINIPTTINYNKKEFIVTSIGNYAFSGCSSLTSITIPNSVTYIGDGAFLCCHSLTSITIPRSVTNIGSVPFLYCGSLTSIKVEAVNSDYCDINGVLFSKDKTTLIQYPAGKTATSYTIPNSVTSIEKSAFCERSKLTSVIIPNSVTSIGERAFLSSSLKSIKVDAANPNYCDINGVLFSKDKTTLIQYPEGKTATSYNIPTNVTRIEGDAFFGCSNLASINISNSVTSIGERAFLSSSLKSIKVDAANLDYCDIDGVLFSKDKTTLIQYPAGKKATLYNIPNSVTSIGDYAFIDCDSLTSITIPNNVTNVGVINYVNCNQLREIYYPQGLDLSYYGSAKLIAYDGNEPPLSQMQPPLLTLEDGSLSFSDATGNNRIDAGEQCAIRFKVKNSGKGEAVYCEVRVNLSGAANGITAGTVKLPSIAVGQTYEVQVPINADINTKDGEVTLAIEVYEPNGWGVAPFDLTVATKAYEAPMLQVVDYNIASASGKIRKMEPFTLTFNLQNTQYGTAEDVKVNVKLPANVFVMDGKAELSFPTIKAGEAKSVQLTLAANNNYPTTNIPVIIDIQEKYGKFAKNRQIDIAINQSAAGSVTIAAKDEPQQERQEIQLALMTAETDRDIPQTGIQNTNTFVVIIANENYQQVAVVPFALNDGKVFRQYCEKTLGIPAKNIREQTNATGGQIQGWVDWLQRTVKAYENDHPNVIFYYAGHGIPDENSRTAYLLPVDGMVGNLNTCYRLDDLYTALGNMPADRITVFMDACFSGSKREQGMIAEARGVALRARPGQPKGNMVVFSAAQGDETAYPYTGKQHGMFTYFLLKKLQDTKGDVLLKELGDYVTEQVSKTAIVENDKPQTPCVTPSNTVGTDWQNWRLR